MISLHGLRRIAAALEQRFEDECIANGYNDRWDAYKSEETGCNWAESLQVAHDAWIVALHNFYKARDGERGFLGSRGL